MFMGAALKFKLIVCWGEKKAERKKCRELKSHEMNINYVFDWVQKSILSSVGRNWCVEGWIIIYDEYY